jgi:coenzyme F420-0:L-glutamate ligase/coenzyme F420-1:gamma-L-glutamate ligase
MSMKNRESGLRYLEFIKSRRSSKLLEPGDVPLEDLMTALEAAVSAPSAHNAQPWRFILLRNKDTIRRLLEAMAEEWKRDLLSDGLDERKVEVIIRESASRTLRASAVIVACLTMSEMDHYPDEKRSRCEYVMAVQSVAAACQNLLLALHALGYGACWRCGPLFAPESVRRVLNIPSDVEPQALIEVGLPGGIRPMRRKTLSEVVFIDRWGEHP